MDALLLQFVKDNLVTLSLALGILKVIAQATPWAVDDKIVQILTGFLARKTIITPAVKEPPKSQQEEGEKAT